MARVMQRLGIVGLGIAGKALAKNAHHAGYEEVCVYDSAQDVPCFEVNQVDIIMLSAGIDPEQVKDKQIQQLLKDAKSAGIAVVCDIELYCRHFQTSVIAVTGSYGKSTVASMIHFLCQKYGLRSDLRGNIGTPIWELKIDDSGMDKLDVLILELSSYQMETVESLHAAVGVVTNISPHHLDRYDAEGVGSAFEKYAALKKKLLLQSRKMVVAPYPGYQSMFADLADVIVAADAKSIKEQNAALAAKAFAQYTDMDYDAAFTLCMQDFKDLPYRMNKIYDANGVRVYENSKATDVVPVIASLKELIKAGEKDIVLICGGKKAKYANWGELEGYFGFVSKFILFGECAGDLYAHFQVFVPCVQVAKCVDLEEVLVSLKECAILFAPGTQSFDEFKNFEERAEVFSKMISSIFKKNK